MSLYSPARLRSDSEQARTLSNRALIPSSMRTPRACGTRGGLSGSFDTLVNSRRQAGGRPNRVRVLQRNSDGGRGRGALGAARGALQRQGRSGVALAARLCSAGGGASAPLVNARLATAGHAQDSRMPAAGSFACRLSSLPAFRRPPPHRPPMLGARPADLRRPALSAGPRRTGPRRRRRQSSCSQSWSTYGWALTARRRRRQSCCR